MSRRAKSRDREPPTYESNYRELFEAYMRLDNILTRRPLKSVIGPTEHHQYRQMVRDISLRAWREIEAEMEAPATPANTQSVSIVRDD